LAVGATAGLRPRFWTSSEALALGRLAECRHRAGPSPRMAETNRELR
jgi:hypothetical protein